VTIGAMILNVTAKWALNSRTDSATFLQWNGETKV
jgi:hypothetical protein